MTIWQSFKRKWRDHQRGYTDADMQMLRLRISSGIKAGSQSKAETNALLTMSEYEIVALALHRDVTATEVYELIAEYNANQRE